MIIGGIGYSTSGFSFGKPSPFVDPKMVEYLIRHGFSLNQIITNIDILQNPQVSKILERKGFYHDHYQFGDKIIDNYNLGDAHPGGYGQTIGIMKDGNKTLTTFAGAYTQIIVIDKNGKVIENHYT
jgi:hypothetical protein